MTSGGDGSLGEMRELPAVVVELANDSLPGGERDNACVIVHSLTSEVKLRTRIVFFWWSKTV